MIKLLKVLFLIIFTVTNYIKEKNDNSPLCIKYFFYAILMKL